MPRPLHHDSQVSPLSVSRSRSNSNKVLLAAGSVAEPPVVPVPRRCLSEHSTSQTTGSRRAAKQRAPQSSPCEPRGSTQTAAAAASSSASPRPPAKLIKAKTIITSGVSRPAVSRATTVPSLQQIMSQQRIEGDGDGSCISLPLATDVRIQLAFGPTLGEGGLQQIEVLGPGTQPALARAYLITPWQTNAAPMFRWTLPAHMQLNPHMPARPSSPPLRWISIARLPLR